MADGHSGLVYSQDWVMVVLSQEFIAFGVGSRSLASGAAQTMVGGDMRVVVCPDGVVMP